MSKHKRDQQIIERGKPIETASFTLSKRHVARGGCIVDASTHVTVTLPEDGTFAGLPCRVHCVGSGGVTIVDSTGGWSVTFGEHQHCEIELVWDSDGDFLWTHDRAAAGESA